ncbi:MAG: flagellar basal body rod protein FlgF [Gammaproteobacteria bacterium]|nr:flagellar basal body rod protein FlgF [Gammaproteobacteria bacterium]
MDRLLYVAMGGAKQVMEAQSLVAHNLANISTPGFRADMARFEYEPVEGAGFPSRINVVADGAGFDQTSGALMHTGRVLDLAIQGEGWFAIQADDGSEVYTRDGALRLNALGLLETMRGELVLGNSGPISIPPHTEIMVGGDGTVSIVPQGQGPETMASVGTIKLVNPDRTLLEKRLDGHIQLAGGAVADVDPAVRVVPEYVEASNVNAAATLVSMIELSRQFEIEIKLMQLAEENETAAASLAQIS